MLAPYQEHIKDLNIEYERNLHRTTKILLEATRVNVQTTNTDDILHYNQANAKLRRIRCCLVIYDLMWVWFSAFVLLSIMITDAVPCDIYMFYFNTTRTDLSIWEI